MILRINILLLSILLLESELLVSQYMVKFSVIDSITKKEIPFMKIAVESKNIGTYSDENAMVILDDLLMNDSLTFRHISYYEQKIPVNELVGKKVILFAPKIYQIKETIVKSNQYKTLEIGYDSKISNATHGTTIKGTELAVLIKSNKLEHARIEEFIFRFKNNATYNPIVRLHFYENNNDKPGKEIYIKNNLITINQSKKMRFNIEKENITMPKNGVFVSMEWIAIYEKNGKIHQDSSFFFEPMIKCRVNSKNSNVKSYYRVWGSWTESMSYPLFGLKMCYSKK